jgi:threonine/homoserine/homoserine lactone efflux protein
MAEAWTYLPLALEGFLLGIPFCLGLGPVMFSVIQNSIEHGRLVGFVFILGVILADLLLLAITFSGISSLVPPAIDLTNGATLAGGLLLLGMGLYNILRKAQASYQSQGHRTLWLYFVMGFGINFLNPTNWISWLAIMTYASQVMKLNFVEQSYFCLGIVGGVLSTETGISMAAHQLKKWLTPLVMRRIHLTTGLVFGGTGLYLIFQVLRRLVLA